MNKINIKKDWDWYLAEVLWSKNLYAFGYTEKEAQDELMNVVDMMTDYHLDLVEANRKIKRQLLWNRVKEYAL